MGSHQQIYALLLNFSKAFNKLPHHAVLIIQTIIINIMVFKETFEFD